MQSKEMKMWLLICSSPNKIIKAPERVGLRSGQRALHSDLEKKTINFLGILESIPPN